MSDNPLKLIVFARDQSARVQNAWNELEQFLQQQTGVEVVASAVAEDVDLDGLEGDLVVVLGGDGAMLRACRQMGTRQIPILGVNLGRLGFLADLSPEEFQTNFRRILQHEYQTVEHLMFECRLIRDGNTIESHLGLNETMVNAAGSLQMLDVKLAVNDEPVMTYSCDGLIIGTPVGSTAHSLSAGGPILRQNMQAFVVTPICPHTLTNRPLVEHADAEFRITIPEVPEGTMVVIDGQIRIPFQPNDEVIIRKAPVSFQLAKIPGHSYYTTLQRKLGWSGQPQYGTPHRNGGPSDS